jgi:hypothetical protein
MVIMGDGLRTPGQPVDFPPYPTITRAPHFYPDFAESGKSEGSSRGTLSSFRRALGRRGAQPPLCQVDFNGSLPRRFPSLCD